MRRSLTIFLFLGSLAAAGASDAVAGRPDAISSAPAGRVVKVLPLLLDLKGHDAISPSLFDRDAYQAWLRGHTNEISAIRFDVLWKASRTGGAKLQIFAELRGAGADGTPHRTVLEKEVTAGFFRSWSSLTLDSSALQNFGSLVAWRVTLWDGDRMLAEQKSFLW